MANWEQIQARIREQGQQILRFSKANDGVPFEGHDRFGNRLIVHQDARGWRVTRLGKRDPIGHHDAGDYYQAVKLAVRDYGVDLEKVKLQRRHGDMAGVDTDIKRVLYENFRGGEVTRIQNKVTSPRIMSRALRMGLVEIDHATKELVLRQPGLEAIQSYKPKGTRGQPTHANLYVLAEFYRGGTVERIPNGMFDAPSIPHVRRCLYAGLIELSPNKRDVILTPAGQKALEEFMATQTPEMRERYLRGRGR